MEGVQDGVAAAPSGTGKSKLETLPREDLIKFAKKQMMLLQKAKARCTELDKEIEELKSKPVDGRTDDIIKVLSERLDSLLLDKAESEQQCLCLKKENDRMKQEVEDFITKLEDKHKEFEKSHKNYVNEIESLKNELIAVHSEHSKDKASLQQELEEAVNKQLELLAQLKSQSDSEDNVKQLQEEIQNITARFEEQILCLQKQLEATSDEKKQEIIHLQKVIEENTQHYQKDINTFQEEILQLRAAHKEVNELVFQMETSAKEHEAEINKIKDNRVQQCEGSESNQEKYHCESKNLNEGTSDASQENQHHSVPLQEDTFGEQTVYDKVRQLEDSLKELESQHSILKDEVTYMNNLKLKLEMEAQHIKDEFFHEREDLEFKINELLLAKEEHGYIVEKLKYEQEDLNRQLCCAVEQHNKEIQRLQEIHQKEISELSETFISGSEKEKLALMFEIQGLKEQCENLQHEKQEAILNYESLREMMEILQTELGESAGKISQEFESMKQQQASDVHELQQKLRTAFNEKDTLLETVNRLQQENKKLFSYQELVPELESIIKSLKVDNSMYLANLGQKDTILQELEAKISSLAEEKNEFVSKMKTCHEEIDKLHQKWEKEQRLTVELKEAAEQTTQHNSVLRQRVDELTRKLDEILREKSQNDQSIMVQIKTMTEDQEALSSKIEFLYEENNRLLSEKVQLSRDLETLQSQRDFSYSKSNTLRNRVTELEGKLQLMVEEQENLNKVFENEQVQKSFVKTQLYGYLKQMGQNILEENEEEDVVKVLQAVGESLAKIKEEKHNLVFEYDERILELERKIKCLQEENVVQHEKLTALLRDSEQVKIVLQKESEETTSTEETLQLNLLEIKNANEKTSLENQVLLAKVEDLSQALHSQNEVYNEKLLVIEHENLKLLLEQRESELQDVRAELILLKDSLEKSPSVKNNQLSLVKELEEKIESLEKESKDKDEKISKIKLVAVKAKKELDSNRKEVQTLREELESVRSEKDRLSTSMKEFIQGAENYKNLLLEYDKQSEQLDVEKERANNLEHHIEDLTKQLRNSTCQYEKLNSDNEDLLARIETLQSNARLLEAQILEVQKAKGIVDKELESEKLQKEQKIKEHVSIVNELEELQLQFEKEKKQLQKTMQELELVKKDAQQTTLMNMEIADYERLMKELNQKLTSKNSKIEDLEQEIKTQKQKQETLQEEMTSLQSSVQHYEEKNTKIKQLLVKTKKELADSKQAETDHLLLQASLKGELEASQQQVEVYKIQLAEITSEKHKIHEHLKTSAEQHQRTLSAYQQRVAALQEESRTAKEEQAAVTSEFESYKVRVHNVLKQQKNKSVSQAETEGAKQERKHLEMLIDQLKIKLQDSQNSLQINVSELQTLQSEHDTLLERHNRMLQETVTKEAELREKLCSVQSKNTMMKSEHSQAVCQLTSQNEALRNSFRDQVRHLQEEHRKTVETLQHQLSKVEAQLFQLKSEPSTRSTYPASSHQPLKNPRERRNTDLPLLDMHTVAREEGEGMETTDSESVSSAGTHIPSLEQLLSSPDTKPEQHLAEPSLWHAEFTKEELAEKLSSTTKSADHLNGLLRETEATNAILMEQIKLLKNEIRRLERNQEREKSVANLEYLKNVLLRFIFLKPGSERERLLPVIDTMLQLSPEEKGKLATVAQGEEDRSSRSSGWASYLHSWSGLR